MRHNLAQSLGMRSSEAQLYLKFILLVVFAPIVLYTGKKCPEKTTTFHQHLCAGSQILRVLTQQTNNKQLTT